MPQPGVQYDRPTNRTVKRGAKMTLGESRLSRMTGTRRPTTKGRNRLWRIRHARPRLSIDRARAN
jgi:hypothetical protein